MNRYTIMLLLVLLTACDNGAGEQTASSQGGDIEKVYSLDGHPLAPYGDDFHIITFRFPVTIDKPFPWNDHTVVRFPGVLYFYQACTKSGVLPSQCETPRRQYIDDAKADGFVGDLLDVVIEEYDQKCLVENIEEKIEENCQREIDTALARLEKIGRTDITEEHLRNPAFWELQEQLVSRLREKGGNYIEAINKDTDALDRLKKFEAGSY